MVYGIMAGPTNAELRQQVEELRELLQQYQRNGTPPVPVQKEPKIAEPPEFNGKPTEYATFINHCDLYFRLRNSTFQNDYIKVAYVISRCRGPPAEWGHSLLEIGSELLHDYDAFKEKMFSMYSDKQRRQELRRRLTALKQTGSAAKFASEFQTITNLLGTDEDTCIALFTKGLKPEVQHALATILNLNTFDDLVDAAIQIDTVNFNLNKADKADKATNKSYSKRPQQLSTSSFTSAPAPRTPSTTPSPYGKSSTPRPPVSPEEKERRQREGLCFYCGKAGHTQKTCSSLLAKGEREKERPRYLTPASTASAVTPVTHVFTPHLTSPPLLGNSNPQGPPRQDH